MKAHTIAALFLCCLLTGCLDVNQSIVVNDDNTATYEITTRLSAALLSMDSASDTKDFSADFCAKEGEIYRSIPKGLNADLKSYYDKDYLVCTIKVVYPLESFRSSNSAAKSVINIPGGLFSIERIESTIFRISSKYNFSSLVKDTQTSNDPTRTFAKTMMNAALSGHAMRWSVSAPKIIRSSGAISADAKSTAWELPLSVAFNEKENYEFEALIEINRPWYQPALELWRTTADWLLNTFPFLNTRARNIFGANTLETGVIDVELPNISSYETDVHSISRYLQDIDATSVSACRAKQMDRDVAFCIYRHESSDENLDALRLAARLGHPLAQNDLAMRISEDGQIGDSAELVNLIRASAEYGIPHAQVSLGWFYMTGEHGLDVNYEDAMRWNRMGYEKGHGEGANNIGELYEKGLGVPPDISKAKIWYRRASELGIDQAGERLRRLEQ